MTLHVSFALSTEKSNCCLLYLLPREPLGGAIVGVNVII